MQDQDSKTARDTAPPILQMTTTEVVPGDKMPRGGVKGWGYFPEYFPAGQHTTAPGSPPGQRADVYARHTGTFALDVDAYKDGKAEAWEQSATGRYLAGRLPYVRRGTGGSQRYLVSQTPEQAAQWHPFASRLPAGATTAWGEIRSAGVGPSPGALHPSGERYEHVPGPDPVRYPDGTVICTNVIRFDDGLRAALEADGARNRDDEDLAAGDAGMPDDDGKCPLILAWLQDTAQLEQSTSPCGSTANTAVNYLKRMDDEGHRIGGWLDEVIAMLPHTSEGDFEDMWRTAPVRAGDNAMPRDCCNPSPLVAAAQERAARIAANGQGQLMPAASAGLTLDELNRSMASLHDPQLGEFRPLTSMPQAYDPVADRLAQLRDAMLDADGLRKIPPPVPLVAGLLYKDSLAWIGGAPGSCKSLAALDITCCVRTGLAWHGHQVAQGAVVYLVLEGTAGMSLRLDAWEAANRQTVTGKIFQPVRVQLLDPVDAAALEMLLAEIRPALVVVDTQAKAAVGAEENSSRDMGLLVEQLERLREASGACVLVVHHKPRNADNLRGSTALEGAANTIIAADKDGTVVTLKVTKQKDGTEAVPVRLALKPAARSVVLTSDLAAMTTTLAASSADVLALLRELGESSRTRLTDSSEMSSATIGRALLDLKRQGLITEVKHGKSVAYAVENREQRREQRREQGSDAAHAAQSCSPEKTGSDQAKDNAAHAAHEDQSMLLTAHTPIGGEQGMTKVGNRAPDGAPPRGNAYLGMPQPGPAPLVPPADMHPYVRAMMNRALGKPITPEDQAALDAGPPAASRDR